MNTFLRKRRSGFTLAELLIIIALLSALVVFVISFMNPKKQIEYTWDMKRKADFSTLRKILEDYYTDKEAYPNGVICDDEPKQNGDICTCTICGLKKSGMSSYFNTAYCDPQHPVRSYHYEYDCSTESPQWFQICGTLSYPPEQNKVGNEPNRFDSFYNFGVASPNKPFTYCVEGCPSDEEAAKYCYKDDVCNRCGSFAECILNNVCDMPVQLYAQPACGVETKCSTVIE